MIKVQQQREAYLVRDPKRSMVAGAAARTRFVNHYRRCGDSTGPGLSPWLLARLELRCRLNDGREPVDYLTDLQTRVSRRSTSYTEQILGGASLSRDQVSLPQPPIGAHATGELSFGELWKEVVSDPGPRTPEGTGGGWGGVAVWRCSRGVAVCRGAFGLIDIYMP